MNVPGYITPTAPNRERRIVGSSSGACQIHITTLGVGEHLPPSTISILDLDNNAVKTFEDHGHIILSGPSTNARKVFLNLKSTDGLQAGTYTVVSQIGNSTFRHVLVIPSKTAVL